MFWNSISDLEFNNIFLDWINSWETFNGVGKLIKNSWSINLLFISELKSLSFNSKILVMKSWDPSSGSPLIYAHEYVWSSKDVKKSSAGVNILESQ